VLSVCITTLFTVMSDSCSYAGPISHMLISHMSHMLQSIKSSNNKMFRRLQMAFICALSTLLQSVAELAIQSGGLCVHPAHTAGTAGSQCAHSVPVFYSFTRNDL
jgi:hypothetical protein